MNNDSLSNVISAEHVPAKIGKEGNPLNSTKRGEIPAEKKKTFVSRLGYKRLSSLPTLQLT